MPRGASADPVRQAVSPFDRQGERYREHLADQGRFADLPEGLFFGRLQRGSPHLFAEGSAFMRGDLHAEALAAS